MAIKYAVQAIPVVEYKGNNAAEIEQLALERLGGSWSSAADSGGALNLTYRESGVESPRTFTIQNGDHFTPYNGGMVITPAQWAAQWAKV